MYYNIHIYSTESPILSLSNELCTPITMEDLETRRLIESVL